MGANEQAETGGGKALIRDICLKPIGKVRSQVTDREQMPLPGVAATVEVFPVYAAALHRIGENSHLWLLTWFDQAPRNVLQTVPGKVNPALGSYGVFGLRAPARPNPIALTLVRLVGVHRNSLEVLDLDAVDGTPVLDIKPYFERDIVFSARTSGIMANNRELARDFLWQQALNHHREICPDLYLAVRSALVAQQTFGHLRSDDISLMVQGSACLADTLQGLTGARLSNPPRFSYYLQEPPGGSVWRKGNRTLTLTARRSIDEEEYLGLEDEEIFEGMERGNDDVGTL
ncbi:tRNA-Thr(GGU) m(6)t(6)A37 methyltransferase TsaA [Acididesulfobacillus acetoxydans]|uniref:FmdE, Molybdenum formylmethanofuran dehydrogenase operon n=1 Tax=Acididesulfobacillus acetoxydans TaxID=1561005 RepID=A0A8S0VVQ2_9FIRM|nr:tRNA (N6-threonylcarbamoyladenosine(37)-N6)-methyltransferase TrmO [Acididesulfobacillus acetoxydans]CAA7599943.1 tRNA-Thr(GGU) m(6)t(6)A37 methyltransferase TsaA [Acididesulfobacillus acetoxydans]CEJ07965.1 FmdE, Molybdenum formylmethanofuran dehydrogenase operon [Acididesulfobacillus acetoxydans]